MNTDWEDGESYFRLRLQIPDNEEESVHSPRIIETNELHNIPTPSVDSYTIHEKNDGNPKLPFIVFAITIFFTIKCVLKR